MNSLKRQKEIQAAATADPILIRYEHGGGRSYILTPKRKLVADYYHEEDREFYHTSRTDWPELTDWAERAWQLLDLMSDRLMNLAPTPNADLLDDVEKLLAELPE